MDFKNAFFIITTTFYLCAFDVFFARNESVRDWLKLFTRKDNTGPLVKIRNGLIEGFLMETETFQTFYAFQGIPYAKPPVGELRFKPPEPAEPWDGIYSATYERDICIQFNFMRLGTMGNENCLFLNVYTPQLPNVETGSRSNKHLLPVLLVIHGGAFYCLSGSSAFHGPKKFIEHNVIVVSFNYRLGCLGFLSTADDSSPGNFGLLDQLLVMKWVKDNIIYFGGNPEAVTLLGVSAGSMSISAHLVSPLSKGLFHRVIMESGVITAPTILDLNPLRATRQLANTFNCPTFPTQQLVNCLRLKDAKELVEFGNTLPFPLTPKVSSRFLPVVDGILLPEHPQLLFERGQFHKVPILTGVSKDEGLLFYFLELILHSCEFDEIEYIERMQLVFINFLFPSKSVTEAVYPLLRKEYFNDSSSLCKNTIRIAVGQMLSDRIFNAPLMLFLSHVSQFVQAYMYVFRYRGAFQLADAFYDNKENVVMHTEEVKYLFDGVFSLIKLNQQDEKMSKILIKLWTNFTKYGNPTPDGDPLYWSPVKSKDIEYLEVDKTLRMKSNYRKKQVSFINDILSKIIHEKQQHPGEDVTEFHLNNAVRVDKSSRCPKTIEDISIRLKIFKKLVCRFRFLVNSRKTIKPKQ